MRNYWLFFWGICFAVSFFSCGIEDIVYLEPPSAFRAIDSGGGNYYLSFTGFNNEEKINGEYIFIGYDVFYYFSSESDKRRVQVFEPNPSWNVASSNGKNKTLVPGEVLKKDRGIYNAISNENFLEIYKRVTLPVTKKMIDEILWEGNSSNVILYFDNEGYNPDLYSNPDGSTQQVIRYADLYPNVDDYPDRYSEYEANGKEPFKGFLDARFYRKAGIKPISDTTNQYRCYFYVLAKGFDGMGRTALENFTESTKSSTITVTFTVDEKTIPEDQEL